MPPIPPPDIDLTPAVPYYELPAGLMAPLVKVGLEADFLPWLFLTLYHLIPTFNDPEKVAFWKHAGKRRKCW